MKPPTTAYSQPAFRMSLLSASDVSCLANTKDLGVSYSLKQYSIMAPCRPVITNSLSDGWTLFCRMSDKWLLCTNQHTFIAKIWQYLWSFALWQQTPKQTFWMEATLHLVKYIGNLAAKCHMLQHQILLISQRGCSEPSWSGKMDDKIRIEEI